MSDGLNQKHRLSKLDEDIAELEESIYGPQEETSELSEQEESVLDDDQVISPDQSLSDEGDSTDDPFRAETAGEDTQPSDSEVIADLRQKLSEAHHRFNRYKGQTDKSLFDLRVENAQLNEKVAKLVQVNTEFRKRFDNPVELDEESRSLLGDQAAGIIEGLKKQVDSLTQQLHQANTTQHQKAAQDHMKANSDQFMNKLRELVPDLDAMNADPDFNDWLRQPDEHGVERLSTLRSDQSRFDYIRVAAFFNEYKSLAEKLKSLKPQKTPVKDSIEAHHGVKTNLTTESEVSKDPSNKGWIKQSEINKFQSDVAHGKYKHNSSAAEAMENKIFKAMGEGKIVADVAPTHQFRIS